MITDVPRDSQVIKSKRLADLERKERAHDAYRHAAQTMGQHQREHLTRHRSCEYIDAMTDWAMAVVNAAEQTGGLDQ